MDKLEFERKIRLLYKQADYNKRREIDQKIHYTLARIRSEKNLYQAFFQAVKDCNKVAVEKILNTDERIDINKQDSELGNTPLIYAVINADIELVKLLLDNGANPLVKNKKGKNSLDAATLLKENIEVIQLISTYIK